jgi:hypothetical protein
LTDVGGLIVNNKINLIICDGRCWPGERANKFTPIPDRQIIQANIIHSYVRAVGKEKFW